MLPFSPTTKHDTHDSTPTPALSASLNLSTAVDPHASIQELFIFSPFGLCCQQCNNSATIQLDERCISLHMKKHGQDSRIGTARSLLEGYKVKLENAKALGTIDQYRSDNNTYRGYSCICGNSFLKKSNAIRHCKRSGCDASKLQKVELMKLCCGQYVSHAQVTSLFGEKAAPLSEDKQPPPPCIAKQFDYSDARAALLPFLPEKEKHDHTYTHMFTPLVGGCGGSQNFVTKIRTDFISIHSIPNPTHESLLITLHQHAEDWLLNYASKNILMVPGNLRAALQTFEGGEVDEVSHHYTYTMQHDPTSLLSELKKLLSFAYRRGLFASTSEGRIW